MRVRVLMAAILVGCSPALRCAAETVTQWLGVITRADDAASSPAIEPTLLTARAATRATLAMFEAANAVERRYTSYLRIQPQAGADDQAAIATAVRAVLDASLPAQAKEADSLAAGVLAALPAGDPKAAGISVGLAAASAAMQAGGMDPDRPLQPYRPAAVAGVWVPTRLPSFGPLWGSLKPWFMPHADSMRPAAPPDRASPAYLTAFQETLHLGSKGSSARTPSQTDSARFWVRTDDLALMSQVAARPGHTPVDIARFYALLDMAGDDSLQATADAKLHYGLWRPITAIRNADLDPSTRSSRVADWEPLLPTPNHPEYPCGHCVGAAVTASIIAADPSVRSADRFTFTSLSDNHKTLELSLPESVQQCSMSRIYAGLHWRFSTEVGEALGRAVAKQALATFAPRSS